MSIVRSLLAFAGLIERPRRYTLHQHPQYVQLLQAVTNRQWPAAEAILRQRQSLDTRDRVINALVTVSDRPRWIDEWRQARSSAEALLVSGAHYARWAWEARGGGYSETVTESGLRLFAERLQLAQRELEAAAKLAPTDPTPWSWLVVCARGLELDLDESRRRFDEAVTRDRRNMFAHEQMLQNLCQKWGGSDELMFAHARAASALDRAGGTLHTLVAVAHLERALATDRDSGLDIEQLRAPAVRNEIIEAARKSIHAGALDDESLIEPRNWFALLFHLSGEHRLATAEFDILRGRMGEAWSYFGRPERMFSFARLDSAWSFSRGTVGAAARAVDTAVRTHRTIRRRVGFAAAILLGGWLGLQHIGPSAAFPTERPAARLDRDWESRSDNARSHYARACDAMAATDLSWHEFVGRVRGSVPTEVVAWAASNEPVIEHIRRAVTLPGCYLRQSRFAGLVNDDGDLTQRIRELSRLLSLRARIAADKQDLSLFKDSLTLQAGLARHVGSQPFVMQKLLGIAIASMLSDFVLMPLEWSSLSTQDRAAYIEFARQLESPPPMEPAAWLNEKDDALRDLAEQGGGVAVWLTSKGRLAAEMERAFAPAIAVASAPINLQVDSSSPVRIALAARDSEAAHWTTATVNAARYFAALVYFPQSRFFELYSRLVACQRGNRAVLAVSAAFLRDGQWPSALPASDEPDPFTGKNFVYRTTLDGFTLYSTGLDGDDDGGRHDERFGEKRDPYGKPSGAGADGDYVFWPIPWREAVRNSVGKSGQ